MPQLTKENEIKKIENENGYIKYDFDDYSNEYVIDMVEVYKKKQGTGTQLVKAVLDAVAEEGYPVTGCAFPQDDSISLDELVSFYKSIGFTEDYNDGSEALVSYHF